MVLCARAFIGSVKEKHYFYCLNLVKVFFPNPDCTYDTQMASIINIYCSTHFYTNFIAYCYIQNVDELLLLCVVADIKIMQTPLCHYGEPFAF